MEWKQAGTQTPPRPSMHAQKFALGCAGAGFKVLPSLESLHIEASRAVCPLASASVRHLSLEGTCGCRMSEYPTIGSLLQLRSISLKLVPNMRV